MKIAKKCQIIIRGFTRVTLARPNSSGGRTCNCGAAACSLHAASSRPSLPGWLARCRGQERWHGRARPGLNSASQRSTITTRRSAQRSSSGSAYAGWHGPSPPPLSFFPSWRRRRHELSYSRILNSLGHAAKNSVPRPQSGQAGVALKLSEGHERPQSKSKTYSICLYLPI